MIYETKLENRDKLIKQNNMNLKKLNIVIQVVIYAKLYNKAHITFNISSAMRNLM